MLYSVDFTIKSSDNFQTIHTAFIDAESVNDCKRNALELAKEISSQPEEIHIFIDA